MKASILSTTSLLLAAGAAAVAASTTIDVDGNNRVLSGSDTLKPVIQQVLAACPGAVPGPTAPSGGNSSDGTYFIGGGQSVGDAAITANTQQLSFGTASVKNTVYCGISVDSDNNASTGTGGKDLPVQGTTEALLLGLDGLSILGNSSSGGIPAAPSSFGLGLAVAGKTFVVHDHSAVQDESGPTAPNNDASHLNGFYGTAGEESAGSSVYTIQSSIDVLRLIYGGYHHDTQRNVTTANPGGGTFNCASDVRKSLANQWESLFNSSASLSGGKLNHAFRRSDLAGTTNAFIALVGFGPRGIGTLTGNTTSNKKTNPFCNSADAAGLTTSNNTGVVVLAGTRNDLNSVVANNAGPGDQLDLDPIRRSAVLSGRNSVDQVASPGVTLGLVLPIFYPDTVGITVAQAFPTTLCDAGNFALVPTGPSGFDPAPQGPSFLSQSFQPYYIGTASKPPADGLKHFNCLSKANAAAFGAFATDDGRQFNNVVRDDATGAYLKDFNNRELAGAFFRIRSAGLPATSSSPILPALLQQTTSDFLSGALVHNDPHTIAFTGRGVDTNPLGSSFNTDIQALWLSGSAAAGFDPTLSLANSDQNVLNLLLAPTGGSVYPLARRTYLTTLVGFTENPVWSAARGGSGTFNAAALASDGGPAVRGLQGQEYELAKCFGDSDHVGAAFLANGFVPLPSAAQGYAPNGVSGLDYPETAPTTPTNLTTQPFAGCAAATNRDAATASPPVTKSYGVSTAAAGAPPTAPYAFHAPWPDPAYPTY